MDGSHGLVRLELSIDRELRRVFPIVGLHLGIGWLRRCPEPLIQIRRQSQVVANVLPETLRRHAGGRHDAAHGVSRSDARLDLACTRIDLGRRGLRRLVSFDLAEHQRPLDQPVEDDHAWIRASRGNLYELEAERRIDV